MAIILVMQLIAKVAEGATLPGLSLNDSGAPLPPPLTSTDSPCRKSLLCVVLRL